MILILILKKNSEKSQCLSIYRDKTDSMYMCHEKYDIQQGVEIELSSRVMCKGSYCSAHTAHITLDVKSSISFPHRIIYYYIFFEICDI